MSGQRPNWLGIEEVSDAPRYVPVEAIQEREMEKLLGWELNLWLMWRVNEVTES